MQLRDNDIARRLIVLPLASGFLAVLVAYVLRKREQLPAFLRFGLALAPILPMAVALVLFHKSIEQLDELQRRIGFEASLFGFLATALLVLAYGMFAKAELLPDLSVAHAWPFLWILMWLLWAGALGLVRRRYR